LSARSRTARIKSDRIVDGILEALLAAQVPLCGLDGNMPKEKLNLLEFTASLMAEAGTSPAPTPSSA
jgi:hypothetical protein